MEYYTSTSNSPLNVFLQILSYVVCHSVCAMGVQFRANFSRCNLTPTRTCIDFPGGKFFQIGPDIQPVHPLYTHKIERESPAKCRIPKRERLNQYRREGEIDNY